MINEEEAKNMEKSEETEESGTADTGEKLEEKMEEMDILKEIDSIKEELERKIDKAEIEEIKGWKAEILSKISSISEEIEAVKKEEERILNNFREFTDIITKKNEEIAKIVEQKVDAEKLKQFRKDMGKIDKKLNLLMEETGFGEILDVAKIPPNILEIVYDSTLKDVTNAIWQEYGPGAEKIIMDVLEDIRLETSGSEMFYFDGRHIRTRDVAKNIKRGMISARQLQDTYEALLRKLLDKVPGHRAKNFRAMIKLKSQEYTVDKTTFLLDRVEKIENTTMMLNGMVSGLANNLNNLNKEIEKMEGEIAKISGYVEKSIEELNKRFDAELSDIRKYSEETMKKMHEDMEKRIKNLEKELMKKIQKKGEEEGESPKQVSPEDLSEEERFIYSAIPKEGITLGRLKKIAEGMVETPLDSILEKLTGSGLIYEKKKGRSVRYYLSVSEESKGEAVKSEEKTEEVKEPAVKKDEKHMLNETLKFVLSKIPERGCTLNRLRKSVGNRMSYEDLLDTVNSLIDMECLVVTTRGRYTIYMKNEEKIKEIGGEKDA